jgi:hypothetical protein
MKFPCFLLTVLLFVISNHSNAQSLNKNQSEYFVLGTLKDYMGRTFDSGAKDILDAYNRLEIPLAIAIDSIIQKNFPLSGHRLETYRQVDGKILSAKIFSATLSNKFNQYYDFKPNGSYTLKRDTILTGKLTENLFKTEKEKLAFLAGAYVRFGQANDTAYCISIANSTSKAKVCYELLKALGCKPSYQIINYIPVGHKVYFHPNANLLRELEKFAYLRKRLNQSLENWIKEEVMSSVPPVK